MPSRSLLVFPDDSATPILDAINHASKSLRVKMFTLSDPSLIQAVIAAHARGVKVRIMLNPARRSGEGVNEASLHPNPTSDTSRNNVGIESLSALSHR
jgi:phosphatidylserine/phosphatidylglycerophosphate/cardiolipin synthase-like enzyme